MRDVYITGVGMTVFGKHSERSLRDLGGDAAMRAIRDAGIKTHEIEAGYCGNALGPVLQGGSRSERLLGSGNPWNPHSER